jgi:NAD(P)-dependent dehydrogenase (short-subunit alcohol dehydrogenase family)
MRLDGQHAVVTGASRGLGAGIAAGLAAAGARVTIVAEAAAELEQTRAALAAAGADVAAACVDLADRDAVLGLGRRLANGPDAADVLVNNAAVLPMVAVERTTDAIWDRALAVNLTASFLLLRAVAPRLAERGGSIVNVSSRAGVMGFADEAAYCASKFGIEGLTRAAALEWRGRPVSVNTVTPGTRIKPTGITAAEFASWPAERQAACVDPAALGPAFVLLATLRGIPSGCRFDLWRLCEAIARDGFEATAAHLLALAETAERSAP